MSNFWTKLNKPIFALAPMEEVTDVVFREMVARYSGKQESRIKNQELRPNDFVMYTEFVNVDGLTHPEGRKNLEIDLKFTPAQRPIVAQIWGTNPEKFYQAAQIIAELGFDGIDINMGCPQDKEIGLGACAALIRQPDLAKEIIKATKKGAEHLSVSVKTRIGYSKKEEMENWIKHLLSTEVAVIALHGRTKQEKSKGSANWEAIAQAVRIRDEMYPISPHPSPSPEDGRGKFVGLRPLILGNGDIKSYQEGLDRVAQTNVDGVMVGRGAFGNPWFFRNDNYQSSVKERLAVMLEYAKLFSELLPQKSFIIMRKHFKAYVSGFVGSHELRRKLMQAKNLGETEKIINEFLPSIS